ncbi:hypothetical protein C8Q76DRAFT_799832 [Earliella scabrosa]|nr:hypothetical protein C8Q76DRAFT_799832 [Earliella scabrosa]
MIRVLDTSNGKFVELKDSDPFEYAILSHTWDPAGEQTYQDVRRIQDSSLAKALSLFVWLWWRFIPLLLAICDGLHLPTIVTRMDIIAYNVFDAVRTSLNTVLPHRLRLPLSVPHMLGRRLEKWIMRTRHKVLMRDPFMWPVGLSLKVQRACAIARNNGHRYIWIDSCCIDKTSSAELSAAINSMYRWYRRSSVCYAFLSDFPSVLNNRILDQEYIEGCFQRSRWFSRGWTLQELIAPKVVVFLDQDWRYWGTKATLATLVEKATKIDALILTGEMELRQVSVARRLSWASRRITTVEEDHAYSLLGIFDINMPTLYGEGSRAFVRLQEEIIKRNPDQSLFAWGIPYDQPIPHPSAIDDPRRFSFSSYVSLGPCMALFASEAEGFVHGSTYRPIPHSVLAHRLGISQEDLLPPTYVSTPYGIRTHLPLISVADIFPRHTLALSYQNAYLAILACEPSVMEGCLIAIICTVEQSGEAGFIYVNGGNVHVCADPTTTLGTLHRLVLVSSDHLGACKGRFRVEEVYFPPEEPDAPTGSTKLVMIPHGWTIHLAKWSIIMLRELGYLVSGPHRSESNPANEYYVLESRRGWIRVEFTTEVTNRSALQVLVTHGTHRHRASPHASLPHSSYPSDATLLPPPSHREDSISTFVTTLAAASLGEQTHDFTVQFFREPHVLRLQESSGQELTIRFTAICLREPPMTGCLDVQVVRFESLGSVDPDIVGGAALSVAPAGPVEGEVSQMELGGTDSGFTARPYQMVSSVEV